MVTSVAAPGMRWRHVLSHDLGFVGGAPRRWSVQARCKSGSRDACARDQPSAHLHSGHLGRHAGRASRHGPAQPPRAGHPRPRRARLRAATGRWSRHGHRSGAQGGPVGLRGPRRLLHRAGRAHRLRRRLVHGGAGYHSHHCADRPRTTSSHREAAPCGLRRSGRLPAPRTRRGRAEQLGRIVERLEHPERRPHRAAGGGSCAFAVARGDPVIARPALPPARPDGTSGRSGDAARRPVPH